MIERSGEGELRSEGTSWCLGYPSHEVEAGKILCDICGKLVAGAHLGTYQVQQLLGQGRSGSAYLAIHLRLKHLVVLKLFPPDKSSLSLWESARRECLFTAQLRHAAILPIISCALQGLETRPTDANASVVRVPAGINQRVWLLTVCYYVPHPFISFLSHLQSKEMQVTGTYTWRMQGARLQNIIQQAGSAISAAHAQNITHGALVPGNFLLDDQERLYVADFGLARLHPPPTPYLAPELYAASRTSIQVQDMQPFWEAVTPMSDQYAFALFCQQLLSHLLRREDYEKGLPALQRAMHQQPRMRFPTIETFVAELFTLFAQENINSLQKENILQPRTESQTFKQGTRRLDEDEQPKASSGSALRAWSSGKTPRIASNAAQVQEWESLGGKHFTMRNYEAAVQAYQRAVALDATRASLWLALGDSCLASTQYTEALSAYERALELTPNDPLIWTNRGATLDALGRHREALMCYERASQLGG